jgi:hypothetical protein
MEIVTIFRVLWRRRLLVVVGLLVSLAVGFKMSHGHETSGGLAWGRVVVDTRKSQLVDTSPYGAAGLPWYAATLSGLVADPAIAGQVAHGAAVPAAQLDVMEAGLGEPIDLTSLAKAAADAARLSTQPYVLVSHAVSGLPVVAFEASAPTPAEAVRLVSAAEDVVGDGVAISHTMKLQPLVINRSGPIHSVEVKTNPGLLMGIGVGAALFLLWCLALPIAPGIARLWRATAPAPQKAG